MDRRHSSDGQGDVSRREFIRTGVAVGATLVGGSCVTTTRVGQLRVRGACSHDCPDTCSWIMTTENGRAVALAGDAEHPFTRGKLCEKMDGFLTDVVYNPERVELPHDFRLGHRYSPPVSASLP